MQTLKYLGILAVLLLLMSGCGVDETERSSAAGTDAETDKASLNSGVKQVEAQKEKEQQNAELKEEAQVADAADKAETASTSEAQKPAANKEQRQRPEAESGDGPTPERTSIHTIVMQNKYGKVAFNHAEHTEFISCSTCHSTEPPSRIEKNRKEFHSICRTCHHEMGAGPVKCSGCHEH
ncbi:MAG: hypothetical protein ABR516_02955 [Desulfuromonadaceae bacterium]|nr:cytochrome c family protein [Geobacteraceae bacterium]